MRCCIVGSAGVIRTHVACLRVKPRMLPIVLPTALPQILRLLSIVAT